MFDSRDFAVIIILFVLFSSQIVIENEPQLLRSSCIYQVPLCHTIWVSFLSYNLCIRVIITPLRASVLRDRHGIKSVIIYLLLFQRNPPPSRMSALGMKSTITPTVRPSSYIT